MSLGMKPHWEKRINKAFAYIMKASPNFVYARRKYDNMKCKDLRTTACESDLLAKVDVIKHFKLFTGIDILKKKEQNKRVTERIKVVSR